MGVSIATAGGLGTRIFSAVCRFKATLQGWKLLNEYRVVVPHHSDTQRVSIIRPSFVDAIEIRHEPRAELGRYFLQAETEALQRGLTVSFITAMELATANDKNRSSWSSLIPVLDCRINTIKSDDIMCIGAFDADGMLVSCVAARRLDIRHSVKSEMESLRFFYGNQAESKRQSDVFELTAPSGAWLRGSILYLGGLWVHPSARNQSLPVLMARIIRYAAVAHWDPDYEIGIATRAMLRPEVVRNHAFKAIEPGFVYRMNGEIKWEGIFFWTDRASSLRNLNADLVRYQGQSRADVRRGEQVCV
jgi:hypothetical protein